MSTTKECSGCEEYASEHAEWKGHDPIHTPDDVTIARTVCPKHGASNYPTRLEYGGVTGCLICVFDKFNGPIRLNIFTERDVRREWARGLQVIRLRLKHYVEHSEHRPDIEKTTASPRQGMLAIEKLKCIQDEIYDLSEGQGE